MKALRTCLLATLVLLSITVFGHAEPSESKPFIGLWITRWDYRTPTDVTQCLDRAADLGVTDVYWQARGAADAFYRSQLEPWGKELFRDLPADAKDPGFDPLEVAVGHAHARGLKLHAWVNLMPLWKGKVPPKDPDHAFNAHPNWRLRDATDAAQPLTDHYVIVNPLLPEVQEHLVAVCKDIVTRYPVDGLHLDYVRFVSDSMADPSAFPKDKPSLAVFERIKGRAFDHSDQDQEAFRAIKRDQITQIVKRIKNEAVTARPGVVLSAAVWRRPDIAHDTYLQDAAAWLNDGTLDRACPMIYTKDDKQFADDLKVWSIASPGKPISAGVGVYLHQPGASTSQFAIADSLAGSRQDGWAVFSYGSLFESVDPNQDKTAPKAAERAARLESIRADIRNRLTAVPGAPVTATPDDRP